MGKKTVITVVTLIVLGIAALCLWGHVAPILVIVGLVVLVFGLSLHSIDKTLQKHPELALLDGTEIVSLRKAEMAAKHRRSLPVAPRITDPDAAPGPDEPNLNGSDGE